MGVFDGNAQAEEGFDAVFNQLAEQPVGKGEVIGGRVVGVGVKIAEQIRNVHIKSAAQPVAHVVQTGKGNACVAQVVKKGKILAVERCLSHAVHGFDGTGDV